MSGFVYFIETLDGEYVKIGYSESVTSRFSAIKTASPLPMKVRGWVPGTTSLERELHAKFSAERTQGEWFLKTSRMESYISGLDLITRDEYRDPEVGLRDLGLGEGIYVGRVSDLVPPKPRFDWSNTADAIRGLQPGESLRFIRPDGVSMSRFRSTLLIYGKRIHRGEWRFSVRTVGKVIHGFLAPLK